MISPIEKTSGPCIILAGAGTGKTYKIIEKIEYLLKNNIYQPEKIVCLTFSNEAANSLRTKILPILKDDREPIMRTFHAFCSDLIKKHGKNIEIAENFRIITPEDAKIMLHKHFKIQPYYCHRYISTIGTAKDLGIKIEELDKYFIDNINALGNPNLEETIENLNFTLKTAHLKKESYHKKSGLSELIERHQKLLDLRKFVQAWKAYEKIKKIKNFQDYSDLNKNAIDLLEKNPHIANEFDYIIVDEFQDTNKMQFDLLKLISPKNNITVVGDLNQSIYRFRGAYKENFNLFKKHFSVRDEEIFTLTKSFRSPDSVLNLAHQLIEHNYEKKEDCFKVENAHNRKGEKAQVYELKNAREETRKIIEIVKHEIGKGTPENEICIMFRTHQQSRMLKKAFEYEKIPYTAVASNSLLKIPIVKKAIDYLKIINSIKTKTKNSEHSWWNLIHGANLPDSDLINLGKFIKNNKDEDLNKELTEDIQKFNLSGEGKIKFGIITKKINDLVPHASEDIQKLILRLYEVTGISSEASDKENFLCLQKLYEITQEHSETDSPDIDSFINHLKIMETLDIEIDAPSVQDSGVRIMTQHATKGLEYKVVVVTNLAQKRFPAEKIWNSSIIPTELSPELKDMLKLIPEVEREYIIKEYETKNQLLEERRLCYVAFTRSKENLYLTYAKEYGNKKYLPSQFLNEIEYKKNLNILFIEDNEEKYLEPNLEIKPAQIQNNLKSIKFSPSSLLLFDECQKKYEYKYIYNMPEPVPLSWEAIKLGSFVHHVAEIGTKNLIKEEKEFIILAKTLQAEEKWEFVNLDDAIPLIRVFFERNKNKYSKDSKTEISLQVNIDGINFNGYADRIDFTDKGVEIIDYKTGNTPVKPKARDWQLGFYALAAKEYGKIYKLTLDMLKKEKPIEFILDSKGNAVESISGRMSFNLDEVKEQLIETAKQILECYKSGFKPCPIEKNCDFCNEYVWNI